MKKFLFALILGYTWHAFQKSWFWKAVKVGVAEGTLKSLEKEFPDFYTKVKPVNKTNKPDFSSMKRPTMGFSRYDEI